MKSIIVVLLSLISISALDINFKDSLNVKQITELNKVVKKYKKLEKYNLKKRTQEARRLYNYSAWMIFGNKPIDYVIDRVRLRRETFHTSKKAVISSSTTEFAGDSSSNVHIMAYISSDCGHCKKVGNAIKELSGSVLKGRLSFSIKPIHHKVGDYALLAANEQGKMWELFTAYGAVKSRVSDEIVTQISSQIGIDTTQLKNYMVNHYDDMQKVIDKNYAECKANGLKYTPMLFINNKWYNSNKHPLWITDFVEFLEANIK